MRKSLNELLTFALQVLPDNNQQLIEPADVRTMFTDFLDTMSPSYGALTLVSRAQNVPSNAQVPVIFDAVEVSLPPEWECDPTTGILRRRLDGVPKLNSRFTINGDFIGPSGVDLTLSLYANGTRTPWQQTVTGHGAGNYATFSFMGLHRVEVDTDFQLRVKSTSMPGPAAITWENFTFLGENVPIRDFTLQPGIQLLNVAPFPVPTPSTLDLDGDGKIDTFLIALPNGGMITVDEDSVNIDSTGDGVADVVIPR